MRVQLHPGLHLLRRGPGRVQIGLDDRHGTLLDGLTGDDLEFLTRLAAGIEGGALAGRTAPAAGLTADDAHSHRVRRLITLLDESGLLVRTRTSRSSLRRLGDLRPRLAADAVAWSLTHSGAGDGWGLLVARTRRRVEVRGGGRTAFALVAALTAAAVGDVRLADRTATSPDDLGPAGALPADLAGDPEREIARQDVAARMVRRVLGAARPSRPVAGAAPDLVVLVDRAAADAAHADSLVRGDVPHLSVVLRESSVLVGPLVLPGRTPCLRCLDLHRADRDAQWPQVLGQLLAGRAERRGPREETVLAQAAGSIAALQVLAHLDGRHTPAAVGATLEVELPDGLVSRRPWPAHAGCGCLWPPRTAAPHAASTGRVGPGPATMDA